MVKRLQLDCSQLKCFVGFISFSGNGHSLVSSILDAHKQAIISREKCILWNIEGMKVAPERVFTYIARASQIYTDNGRPHKGSGTKHIVLGAHNGFVERPLVIGDKHGFGTAVRIKNNPELLKMMRKKLGLPLKFIHVYRTPFAATEHYRRFRPHQDLDRAIWHIKQRYSIVESALKNLTNYHSVKMEDLLRNPKGVIRKLLNYVGLSPYPGYLKGCEELINPEFLNQYLFTDWTNTQVDNLTEFCLKSKFLRSYVVD